MPKLPGRGPLTESGRPQGGFSLRLETESGPLRKPILTAGRAGMLVAAAFLLGLPATAHAICTQPPT
jgi:hypothetical protein